MGEATDDGTHGAVRAADDLPVLICGLGGLGARCVDVLHAYGVAVRTLDLEDRDHGGAPSLRGDCRTPDVLRRVGLERCRAVLFVTPWLRARRRHEGRRPIRASPPSDRQTCDRAERPLAELRKGSICRPARPTVVWATYIPSRDPSKPEDGNP